MSRQAFTSTPHPTIPFQPTRAIHSGFAGVSRCSTLCLYCTVQGTGKIHPSTGHEGPEKELRYSCTLSLTSALERVCGQRHTPAGFTSGKNPVPIVWDAGWAPGTVWTGAIELALTGIPSPDRPDRSESLYRLSYIYAVSMCMLDWNKCHPSTCPSLWVQTHSRWPTTVLPIP